MPNVLSPNDGPAGEQVTLLTSQGSITATAVDSSGPGFGLPAAGDVIPDPLNPGFNLVDRLHRFKFTDPFVNNGALLWTPNPPNPANHWVVGDYGPDITVGFPTTTIDSSQVGRLFVDVPAISGAKTISMPTPITDPTLAIGKCITICDQHGSLGGGNTLQILGNGHTINGATDITLLVAFASVTLEWRGTILGWVIVARSLF